MSPFADICNKVSKMNRGTAHFGPLSRDMVRLFSRAVLLLGLGLTGCGRHNADTTCGLLANVQGYGLVQVD